MTNIKLKKKDRELQDMIFLRTGIEEWKAKVAAKAELAKLGPIIAPHQLQNVVRKGMWTGLVTEPVVFYGLWDNRNVVINKYPNVEHLQRQAEVMMKLSKVHNQYLSDFYGRCCLGEQLGQDSAASV